MLLLSTGTYNIWERVTCFIDWLNLCKRPCLKICTYRCVWERERKKERIYEIKIVKIIPWTILNYCCQLDNKLYARKIPIIAFIGIDDWFPEISSRALKGNWFIRPLTGLPSLVEILYNTVIVEICLRGWLTPCISYLELHI